MSNSKKIWIGVLASAYVLAFALPAYAQPCPQPNPILGANEVCPGSATQYTMTLDNPLPNTFSWQLFGTGGQIIGPTNGTTITIQWQNTNGGPFLLRCTERVGMCSMENELSISVADDLVRRPFNCFGELSIPFDQNCEKLILPEHLLTTGAPDCANSFIVELSIDGDIPVPNPVGIEYLGQIITAKVIHRLSGRSCISRILLKDGSAPRLFCENDTTICNDPLAWDPFHPEFKRPYAEDNCSGEVAVEPQGYEWIQLFNDPLFDAFIVRNWSAVDKYNNRATCQDTIFLRRVIFDQILCPPDTVISCHRANLHPLDSLYFSPLDPLTSGVPTFDGFDLWSARSYCDFTIKYKDLYSYKCPGTYTIHRYWYMSQITPMAIFEDTCHQVIEIIDTVGPVALFDSTKVSYEYHTDVFGLPSNKSYKTVYFPTLDHECIAYGYFPTPIITDDCTHADSVIVDLIWDNGHINYVNGSPQRDHLRFENLKKGKHIITIKLRDACHNTSYDTLIAVAKDRQAPYLVVDKYPVVTLSSSGEVTWIDVSVFDEGTWDNCGVSLLLARRVDWWKKRVNLCDDLTAYCYNKHDSLYCANLESDKHINEVEAYYYNTMRWLQEDGEECGELLWNAWRYDLCKKATLECNHYTTNPGEDYFKEFLFGSTGCFEAFGGVVPSYQELELWDQLGGGWSKEVPFDCEDACEGNKVTIEIIALDAHCNISRIWVDVEVEDKSAPEIQHRLPDLDISCWAYNHYYRDSIDQGNFGVFGKYEAFPKGQYSNNLRKTIIYDRLCDYTPTETVYYEITSDTILNGLVLENCELLIDETQKVRFEKCGIGWIERHFVFNGACNSSKTEPIKVIQRINIYNDCPLQEYEIIWPSADTTIYACAYVDIKTQAPRLKHEDECREIGIHYKDHLVDVLYNVDSTCLKVIRTWAIIDWCRQTAPYHADWIGNQNYHYYEFDQIIYIKNTSGPEIFDCDIDTICIGTDCTADLKTSITVSDDCTPPEDIKVSWILYEKTDYGFLPLDQGDTRYAYVPDLPLGDYRLVWKAEDACHNTTFCTDNFSVKDCVKPTPVCLSSTTLRLIPIDLNQDGQIDTAIGEIWAHELDISSYDNCSLDFDLRIRIKGTGSLDAGGRLLPPAPEAKQLGFGCADIGRKEVEMWVVDQSGNADYCLVSVQVAAPVEGCKGELGKVRGTVSSMSGAGIADVQMLLQNQEEILQVVTSKKGQYDFGSYAMDGTNYQLWPEKFDNPIDGITTLDVIRISKHLLSKSRLESTFEHRAADVNGDGKISVLDIITLRKLILGKIDQLPHEQPWQFFNQKMESKSSLNLSFDYTALQNFTGIKVGDVNGDITNYSSTARSAPAPVQLTYPDQQIEAGKVYTVDISIQEPTSIEGFQMELSLDAERIEILGLQPVGLDIDKESWNILDDKVFMSWIDQSGEIANPGVLFNLIFKSLNDGQLSDMLALTSGRLQNELYTNAREVLPFVLIGTKPGRQGIILDQNVPNPFRALTTFPLYMDQPAEVIIRLSDLQGKVYLTESQPLGAGYQNITISGDRLGGAGIYLFELLTGDHHEVRKIILLE